MASRLFQNLLHWVRLASVLRGRFRSYTDLWIENAALRHQNDMLLRKGVKPSITEADRWFWVWLVRLWPGWRETISVVQPQTVQRWFRERHRRFWRRRSKPKAKRPAGRPPLSPWVIQLIKRMARENTGWGTKHIVDELLLKLGIEVSKTSVRKYLPRRTDPTPGSTWRVWLAQEAKGIFCCDFFTQPLANFETLHVFVVMHLESRRLVHFGVTRNPTLAFVQQCIKEAVGWDETPKFLIHDNDGKFGHLRPEVQCGPRKVRLSLDRWLWEVMGIEGVPTPFAAPKANAHCERLIKTLQTECLDHFIFLNERHLFRTLREFAEYYNRCRTHQGIKGIPDPAEVNARPKTNTGRIKAWPILSGLHHDYSWAA